MNNIANKTSLWQLLDNSCIVIPILQRDYAQGRIGFENLRENFLLSIKKALDDPKEQLKLDFVYGSSDQEGRFNPLDGQQRLTTLWLLYWYLAFRLGKLSDETVSKHLRNFSYETRSSSTQFCFQLVKRGAEIKIAEKENIADAIIRQTWVPSAWRQDPTVQAMMRMLSGEINDKVDGIEELFCGLAEDRLEEYWKRLVSPAANCPVIFYELDLENLGQSDDLYVKMNGRGKPLSDFENFKADLIKYITDLNWEVLTDPVSGLPILMDTVWTDFFWQYRNESISLDDMFFGFINRYFLVKLMKNQPTQKIEDKELGDSKIDRVFKYLYSYTENEDKRIPYNKIGFGIYKDLFEFVDSFSLLYDLRTVMENIRVFDRKTLADSVKNRYSDDTFEVVYTSRKDNYYLQTQQETAVFGAVIQFFESPREYQTLTNFKNWMRIVWNVCSYTTLSGSDARSEIRTKGAMRSVIISFSKYFPSLSDVNDWNTFNTKYEDNELVTLHIAEEQEKIKKFSEGLYSGQIQCLQGKTWEVIIREEETIPIFNGTMRVLFSNNDGKYDWTLFDTKYKNLHWYLDKYGDLNEIAYRNYLLKEYNMSKQYWFPKGEKRNSWWRMVLPYHSQPVDEWLLSEPLDETGLENIRPQLEPYSKRCLIQKSLISEATSTNGMYLAYSWTNGFDVFIHHQNSNPYVVFNEHRDNVINEALKQNIIKLENPKSEYNCGLFDARDIVFDWHGVKYNWQAKGVISTKSNPEIQQPQPNSVKSLLDVLALLNSSDVNTPTASTETPDSMTDTKTT